MSETKQEDGGARTATMRDGARLSFRVTKGEGSRRIVLVHSLAMSGGFWDEVVPHLRSEGDVLVYDCRGHGRSDAGEGGYTAELFANDLADLLSAVGWPSATVCGASMGGCVALAFAAAYPGQVDALGLFDTTAWYGADAPAAWEGRAGKAREGGMAALVDFQVSRWFSDRFRAENPGQVDKAVAVFLANDVEAYARTCRMLGAADARAALPAFRVPCRIAVGSEDYATPVAMAEAMAEAIPGATLHVIGNARHFTPLEVPDIIARHIAELSSDESGVPDNGTRGVRHGTAGTR